MINGKSNLWWQRLLVRRILCNVLEKSRNSSSWLWYTRFLPATKAPTKGNASYCRYTCYPIYCERSLDSGIEEILLIITGRNKRAIEDHFDNSRLN